MASLKTLVVVRDVLKEASAFVSKGWCRGIYAQDAEQQGVSPLNERACSWCSSGAITAAMNKSEAALSVEVRALAMEYLMSGMYVIDDGESHGSRVWTGISHWNDVEWRTHEEVCAAFDLAVTAVIADIGVQS